MSFTTLLVKELKALLRDGRASLLALAGLVLFAATAWVGAQRAADRETERLWVDRAVRSQWDTQGDKHPHRGAHFGLYALREQTALAGFDPGVSRAVGQALYLEPHRRNIARFPASIDEPAASRMAELTPAFIAQFLLPLLVFMLSFSSVSGERETGTLRLVRASGQAAFPWLLAKALAAWMLVASVVVLGSAPVLAAAIDAGADSVLRAVLLLLSLLVIAFFHACIGVAVSASSARSRTALLTLVATWVVLVLAAPRIGAEIASRALPTPSPQEFWSGIAKQQREGLPGESDLATQLRQFEERTLAQYDVARVEDLPVGFLAMRRLFRDAHSDRVHAVHFAALWDRYLSQQELALVGAGFSPTQAWRRLSMALAGTDLLHEREFQESAERYRQAVNTALDRWDVEHGRGIVSFDARYASDELWRSIGGFDPARPTVLAALRAVRLELACLLAWLALSLAGLAWASRRLSA